MVTQLQPDVRAYLHGGEVIKRYIRVEEVAHEYGFSVEETEYIAKAASSLYKLRNSDFRDTQVDIKDNSWSFEAGLRTCQNNSSSIRYGGKGISFIRKNGHILRGGEHICRLRVYS